tara:strand:- start:380 stop:595 length:216 start_codon:yes stop_codon:yes gene_type:complete
MRSEAMSTFETSEVSHDEMVAIMEIWDAEWEADMDAYTADLERAEMAWDIATRAEKWEWFTTDPEEGEWDG